MESVLFLRCLNFRLPSFSLFYPTSNSIWRCKLRYAIDFIENKLILIHVHCSLDFSAVFWWHYQSFFFQYWIQFFRCSSKKYFCTSWKHQAVRLNTSGWSFRHWQGFVQVCLLCFISLKMFVNFQCNTLIILTEQCISCLYFAQQMHSV